MSDQAKAQDSLTITVVFDNYEHKQGLETSWGFACVIQGMEKTLLFDTGADGEILLRNMKRMNLDPQQIESLVISHDHWDHTGGLQAFLGQNDRVDLYLLDSFSQDLDANERFPNLKAHRSLESRKICEHVYTTGKMGSRISEQSLIIDTSKGLIVITGCAHPGIVDIVKQAKTLLSKKIFLVMGGFHLRDKNDTEIADIIQNFQSLGVNYVGASHCTGDKAIKAFANTYKERAIDLGVGQVIRIDDLQ
jgi:7,8-dihydropterin-6-yl-methyl-4-(beta-D-ribofuranosyl)aminobenzene 5'-phosphate synthase